MRRTKRIAIICAAAAVACAVPEMASAALSESQVLLVYNSLNADSLAVKNYYTNAQHRPNVLTFDLASTSLSAGTITYSNYETQIASKIRDFLSDPAHPNRASDIACITLTKGIPTRIQDYTTPFVGDSPGGAENQVYAQNATYATVDSELTMLFQNTHAGEAGGQMDSKSDNFIINPYYGVASSFTNINRSNIKNAATFTNVNAGRIAPNNPNDLREFHYWQIANNPQSPPLNAGYMYLTTRLDGNTVTDVQNLIDRAKTPVEYERYRHKIVLDRNPAAGNLDEGSYAAIASYLATRYNAVVFDNTGKFIIGNTGTVPDPNRQAITGEIAVLASYGGNHSFENQTGFVLTYNGQLVRGAIMNTTESYNAKNFGGQGGFGDQGQLAEWVAAGGTFGVGNAWEPFVFSISDTNVLLQNFMYNNLSWAEAAWASMPVLSWQQVVLGDALATASVVPEPSSGLVALGAAAWGLCGRRRRRQAISS